MKLRLIQLLDHRCWCDLPLVKIDVLTRDRRSTARIIDKLFHNNVHARDDQGGNPGQVIEGSTVSSKICDRRRHHDSQGHECRLEPAWPKLIDVTGLWQRCTSVRRGQRWTSHGGLSLPSSSQASQTVSHALTGRYSKFLTSYAHAYLTYLSHTSRRRTHTAHTNQFPTSLHGMRTGPIDGLCSGVQSRLGSCPQRTNKRTNRTRFQLQITNAEYSCC